MRNYGAAQASRAPWDEAEPPTSARRWQLPNAAARDPNLTAAGLVVLAYRQTFADDKARWGIPAGVLSKICATESSGKGRGAGQAAIANIRDHGYLDRPTRTATRPGKGRFPEELAIGGNKRLANGQWAKAKDTLTSKATDCGKSGHAGRHICRGWFNRQLGVKELAVFFYLRAGTGKGPVMVKDVATRFDWSDRTALKVLNLLRGKGLAHRARNRTAGGRMGRVTYECAEVDENLVPKNTRPAGKFAPESTALRGSSDQPHARKPSNGSPSNGITGNSRRVSLHTIPTGLLPPHTASRRNLHFRRGSADLFEFWKDEAWSNLRLLAWASSDEPSMRDFEFADFDEHLDDIWDEFAEALPDAELRDAIRNATDGSVHPDIIAPEGLWAVRWLALVRAKGDTCDFYSADALHVSEAVEGARALMKDVATNVKDKGRYLNSLKLIGDRLFGCVFTGNGIPRQGLYVTRFKIGDVVRLMSEDGSPLAYAPVKIEGFMYREWERHATFMHPDAIHKTAIWPTRLCEVTVAHVSHEPPNMAAPKTSASGQLLQDLQGYDQSLGRILASKLFQYPAARGFNALVMDFGRDLVADVTRETCRLQGALNGKPVGSVVSWDYIRKAIKDRLAREKAQAAGDDGRRPT